MCSGLVDFWGGGLDRSRDQGTKRPRDQETKGPRDQGTEGTEGGAAGLAELAALVQLSVLGCSSLGWTSVESSDGQLWEAPITRLEASQRACWTEGSG